MRDSPRNGHGDRIEVVRGEYAHRNEFLLHDRSFQESVNPIQDHDVTARVLVGVQGMTKVGGQGSLPLLPMGRRIFGHFIRGDLKRNSIGRPER